MKTVSIILILTLCVLPAISLSHAQESFIYKTAAEGALLDYQESPAHNKIRLLASAVYNGAADKRFSLSGDRVGRDNVARRNDTDTSRNSNINMYNLPSSFVHNVTYDYNAGRFNRTSGHSFLDGHLVMTDIVAIGAAFLTNLAVHEFGHEVVANYVGAEGSRMNFFKRAAVIFFLVPAVLII